MGDISPMGHNDINIIYYKSSDVYELAYFLRETRIIPEYDKNPIHEI